MASIRSEREAIASALSALPGLQSFAEFPGQIAVGCTVVRRRHTRYGQGFAGQRAMVYGIDIYVPIGEFTAAQQAMDDLLDKDSDTSVITALRRDPSFGGAVASSTVVEVGEDGRFENDTGAVFLTTTVTLAVGSL